MGPSLLCRGLILLVVVAVVGSSTGSRVGVGAEQCGRQAGGKFCPNSLCCSQYGWCGTTSPYCGTGCQSQCGGGGTSTGGGRGGSGIPSIITSTVFDQFFDHHNDGGCPANGFYTYNAFFSAASAFPGFGTASDSASNRRELAAFFANAAHEVTGGCYKEEVDKSYSYCSVSPQWGCAGSKNYYGRGPLQISWNYNYGQAGRAIGFDGINNPDIVATDPVISFKTAIWFWMTPQSPKPSCHSAITGNQGFGKTISIINGGIECGNAGAAGKAGAQDRINLYKRFCGILGVQPGNQLTC